MILTLIMPAALAAMPDQAEAHALVAGSAVAVYEDGADPALTTGAVLDYARMQGIVRHRTASGKRMVLQVQFEAMHDPYLLDALAVYAPSKTVSVEVGYQRTWLSEMFDVLVPVQVLRGRTAPEGVAPGRRMGGQVVLGKRQGRGTRAHIGAWASPGVLAGTFSQGILSAVVEHHTDSDLVLHGGAWATPDSQTPGTTWQQGADLAVGFEPKRTRVVGEVAVNRDAQDATTLGATVYASHRPEKSKLEPAGFLDYRSFDTDSALPVRTAGARAGLTVHLVDKHAQWTTDVGVQTLLGQDGTTGTAGTRLMVGF